MQKQLTVTVNCNCKVNNKELFPVSGPAANRLDQDLTVTVTDSDVNFAQN
jgi:hypothetical protein